MPDTAIEWVDTAMGAVRGVSVRGHVHRYEGSVRQDQLAIGMVGETLVCAIGDGVGSQRFSHQGAAIATRHITQWDEVGRLVGDDRHHLDCREIALKITFEAQAQGLPAGSLSSTLTFAAVSGTPRTNAAGEPRWHVVIGQIGDSHAYQLDSGSSSGAWRRVTTTADGVGDGDDLSNIVSPLPAYHLAQLWHLEVEEGDVLALTTDGVGNLLEDQADYAAALGELWRSAAPTPSGLLHVLDASVKSYDDDRTLLGIRFGNPA